MTVDLSDMLRRLRVHLRGSAWSFERSAGALAGSHGDVPEAVHATVLQRNPGQAFALVFVGSGPEWPLTRPLAAFAPPERIAWMSDVHELPVFERYPSPSD